MLFKSLLFLNTKNRCLSNIYGSFRNIVTPVVESLFKARFKPCNFIKRATPTQVLSCEYCEIFRNTYFEKDLQTAASVKK